MGRAGIRRRKRKQPLPPVNDWPDDTPPVMWSPPGSGFEASPYSPAGRAQGMWRMAIGANASRRSGRLPRWLVLGTALTILAVLVVPIVSALVQLVL